MATKKIFYFTVIALVVASCDKIENPYPDAGEVYETILDYTLYPGGDSVDYVETEWPIFVVNLNVNRNVLIEDFTGQKCIYCAPAADTAHALHEENPYRVLTTAIHAGQGDGSSPAQPGQFQLEDLEFTQVLYNQDGLDMGQYFGYDWPGSAFTQNPSGNVSRVEIGGQIFSLQTGWRSRINAIINSQLKVNLQSHANFYPAQSGNNNRNAVFLHTEVEVLDPLLNPDSLYTVVYLVEDSIIGKQKLPPPAPTDENYVHRNVMRDCVGTSWRGARLSTVPPEGTKYYFNYSFEIPSQYNPYNMHLLIYVRDATTEEIYHVIEQDIQ